jgi:hypothetical protein
MRDDNSTSQVVGVSLRALISHVGVHQSSRRTAAIFLEILDRDGAGAPPYRDPL